MTNDINNGTVTFWSWALVTTNALSPQGLIVTRSDVVACCVVVDDGHDSWLTWFMLIMIHDGPLSCMIIVWSSFVCQILKKSFYEQSEIKIRKGKLYLSYDCSDSNKSAIFLHSGEGPLLSNKRSCATFQIGNDHFIHTYMLELTFTGPTSPAICVYFALPFFCNP